MTHRDVTRHRMIIWCRKNLKQPPLKWLEKNACFNWMIPIHCYEKLVIYLGDSPHCFQKCCTTTECTAIFLPTSTGDRHAGFLNHQTVNVNRDLDRNIARRSGKRWNCNSWSDTQRSGGPASSSMMNQVTCLQWITVSQFRTICFDIKIHVFFIVNVCVCWIFLFDYI